MTLLLRSIHFVAVMSLAVLLSACGNAFKAPAAVVDGHEISQDALQHRYQVALANEPQLKQRIRGPGGSTLKKNITRQLLAGLIEEQVLREYAQAKHISVSTVEVAAQLAQIVRQQGGQAAFDRLLRQSGLALADLRSLIEVSLLQGKVATALAAAQGVTAGSAHAQQVFADWLHQRLARAGIRVNPLFGRLDPANAAVCPITSTSDVAVPCPRLG